MINLLPIKNKKKVHKLYYFRLGTLALSLWLVALVIGIILLSPSFFLVKTKEEVVKKLRSIGYIDEYSTEKTEKIKKLKIKLKYDNGKAALSHIKRLSTHGLRVYSPSKKLRPVLGGMGHTLL